MSGKKKLIIWTLVLALGGLGWWQVLTDLRARKQEQIAAELAAQKLRDTEEQAQHRAQREKAHAMLMAMTNDDFVMAGQRCIDLITREKSSRNSLG